MNTSFDDIRCYNDNEIPAALERICNEKAFLNVASTIYPLLPKSVIKSRLLNCKTADDFQMDFVYPFLMNVEENLTRGVELKGLENIDTTKPHVYISNHRDIVIDPTLLCFNLLRNNLESTEVAIGSNLLIQPWIDDLVRINKCFIVKRGVNVRQLFDASKHLSEYIAHVITEKKRSIWLAQREGRAKDSNDRTQESILKMLNMSGTGSFVENILRLNVCPMTISYEYDPCDYLKAKEFQQKRDNPDHKKHPLDDLTSMQVGIMGYKGKVVYAITGNINAELEELGKRISNKNELIAAVTQLIDKRIHSNYTIYKNNKIAFDILNKTKRFEKEYSLMDKLDFERYLEKQIANIDLENKDTDFLMVKLLEMYANPLINYLKATE